MARRIPDPLSDLPRPSLHLQHPEPYGIRNPSFRARAGTDTGMADGEPWIVPIPGTTQMPHMLENVGAAAIRFTPAELALPRLQRRQTHGRAHPIVLQVYDLPAEWNTTKPGGLVVEVTDGTVAYNSTPYRISVYDLAKVAVSMGRTHE